MNLLTEVSLFDLQRGYMIQIVSGTSTLDIQDTCFVNNNVIGPGLIILNSTEVLTGNVNISITTDDDVTCQFVAVETTDETNQVIDVTCVDADASSTCNAPFDISSEVLFLKSAVGSTALSWMISGLLLVVPVLVM